MRNQQAPAQEALPVGVVIPTLNAMPLLPAHVESMRPWLPLVREIIVVDSHSEDGSADYLREALAAHEVEIHQRPRGLYQAWNFGISRIRSPYVYISTVGDSITADGLRHLVAVAEALEVDIVLSPPAFIDERGQPIEHIDWPIHRLLRELRLHGPARLSRWAAFGLAVISGGQALLGSSASNLYRSECLQQRPFSPDYGTAGDTAWGLQNALQLTFAVTPAKFSTFREHEKAYAASTYAVPELVRRLEELAEQTFATALRDDPSQAAAAEAAAVARLFMVREQIRVHQRRLSAARRSPGLPWFLRPGAWRARWRRNAARRAFERTVDRFFRELDHRPAPAGEFVELPRCEWARSG
ncbi:MAG: glycosyltransferase family 2 protein [Gammaproteobacteria bacterium]|nr:MAG: glycosyltransferase family 2 protein [Gammaproteobacteria bacterium]